MEYGAHLPLIDFSRATNGAPDLAGYAADAGDLGFRYLCANDHLVFSRPWLDGIVALASVIHASGSMRLMTTVGLPTIRGVPAFAKAVAAIDVLSGGRMEAGAGPGSSARDYALAGTPFEERWPRFEHAVNELREYLSGEAAGSQGERLLPAPVQGSRLPLWIGSWGSDAGLRRVARLADGWLASAYNTTPGAFGEARTKLTQLRRAAGEGTAFPNALGTMWMFVTEDAAERRRFLEDVLCPMLNRPPETLREILLIGPAEACAERLRRYADEGLERVFVWPLADEREQLERFATRVVPLVD